jgi:2-C-methyl-D-erythritol 4-phosphate cytidylyltransferase
MSTATTPTLAAIIVAAGRGSRMGGILPKAFLPLGRDPLFLHALQTFARLPQTRQLLLVVARDFLDDAHFLVAAGPHPTRNTEIVVGGAERQDSVAAALAHVGDADLVAVHDAARPFVRSETIHACAAAAAETGAAIVALPARDTIKIADAAGCIAATPDRRTIWQAQTPQIFRRDLLRQAYARAQADGLLGTDDASLVERLGARVRLVEGDPTNRKLTTPDDMRWAEWWLTARPS